MGRRWSNADKRFLREREIEISKNGNATYLRPQQQGKGEMHEDEWKVSFGDTGGAEGGWKHFNDRQTMIERHR